MPYIDQRQIEQLNELAGKLGIENPDAWVKETHQGVVAGVAELSAHQAQALIERWTEEAAIKAETAM